MAWLFHSYQITLLHTHNATNILLITIALNKDKPGTFSHSLYTSSIYPPLFASPPKQNSAQSRDTKRHQPRKSAQKKSERVSICPVSVWHLARQLSQPSKLGLSYSFGAVWHAAVCVCMWCTVLYSVCVLICVTYNSTQVKMGQNSKRAAWADLGVAPRVCAVVSTSNDMTGLGPVFLGASLYCRSR